MNKMITGALAGTAGIALLAGGFSTYATWTATAEIDAGRIQTGTLEVTSGPAVWDDLSTATANDWTVGTDKMVPGDSVKLTQPLNITATGKNLKGVKLSIANFYEASGIEWDDFTVTVDNYAGKTFTGAEMVWGPTELAALNADDDITVTFTMKSTADKSKNAYIDLNDVAITVTQVQ